MVELQRLPGSGKLMPPSLTAGMARLAEGMWGHPGGEDGAVECVRELRGVAAGLPGVVVW